jgi:hypothetical protein
MFSTNTALVFSRRIWLLKLAALRALGYQGLRMDFAVRGVCAELFAENTNKNSLQRMLFMRKQLLKK